MDLIVRYYQITIQLKDKSIHKGIRETEFGDIDSNFITFRSKADENYGQSNIIYFQCVQLSKDSDEVKDYKIKKSAKSGVRNKKKYNS